MNKFRMVIGQVISVEIMELINVELPFSRNRAMESNTQSKLIIFVYGFSLQLRRFMNDLNNDFNQLAKRVVSAWSTGEEELTVSLLSPDFS